MASSMKQGGLTLPHQRLVTRMGHLDLGGAPHSRGLKKGVHPFQITN